MTLTTGPLTPDPPTDAVAHRLLRSTAKQSYDPEVDIDWDAPLVEGAWFMQPERLSLYGTPMWDAMSPEQRVELSRHEIASIASVGLWFEIILMQMMVRELYDQDPRSERTQYALTEVGDETRHSVMFGRAIRTGARSAMAITSAASTRSSTTFRTPGCASTPTSRRRSSPSAPRPEPACRSWSSTSPRPPRREPPRLRSHSPRPGDLRRRLAVEAPLNASRRAPVKVPLGAAKGLSAHCRTWGACRG